MEVEIERSRKRKKTISAQMVDNKLVLKVPWGLSRKQEEGYVARFKDRFENARKKKYPSSEELLERFEKFNKKYFEGKLHINSIKFVSNQNRIFGSCTPLSGTIRISEQLIGVPRWVMDYVIVHEMAHLKHPDHSKDFWEMVNRYRFTERARGYLICKGMEDFSENE